MKTPRILTCFFVAGILAPAFAYAAADTAKSTDAKASAAKPASSASTSNQDTSANAAAFFQTTNYKLRPTDLITVNVVDDPKATGDFKIDVDGTVQLTYLDHAVKLVGVSTADAAKLIIKSYMDAGIFVKPSITVSVKEPAPRYVKFIGQVQRQGPILIPPSKEMTLAGALAEAGGPLSTAAQYVDITRINPDGTTQVLHNVDLLAAVKDAKKDIPLQEGDTISLGQSTLGDVWH